MISYENDPVEAVGIEGHTPGARTGTGSGGSGGMPPDGAGKHCMYRAPDGSDGTSAGHTRHSTPSSDDRCQAKEDVRKKRGAHPSVYISAESFDVRSGPSADNTPRIGYTEDFASCCQGF